MSEQGQLIPVRPGDALRQARVDRGLSLSHVAQQLRIRERILQAIEDDQVDDITPVYLKGYLKAYAGYLDVTLDDQALAEQWHRSSVPELRSIHSTPAQTWTAERWLKATSYMVASVLIAALAWQFTHQAVRFSQGDGAANLVEGDGSSSGDAAGKASGTLSASPVESSNGHINASIAALEVLQQSRKTAGEDAWAALSSPLPIPQSVVPGGSATIPDGHNAISLVASADSWVEIIDASGRFLEMDLIRGGVSRAYVGQPPIRVLIGRASAVELTMDDRPIDLAPHTRGNVARLTLGADMPDAVPDNLVGDATGATD